MSKNTLALLVAAALTVPAVASANDFSGFGISADLLLKSTGAEVKTKYVESYGSSTYTDSMKEDEGGKQNVLAGLNVWYGFDITSCVVLQVGATADLGKHDVAKFRDSDGYSAKVEEKNHYSFYVAPGYLVTPKTLVYGKLAYHNTKLKMDGNDFGYYESDDINGSKRFNGWGLGGGISTMLTDNLFVYAEAQHVWYESKKIFSYSDSGGGGGGSTPTWSEHEQVKAQPNSTIGVIGIGYNF